MTTFARAIAQAPTYQGNVVVKILGQWLTIRKPDSGLDVLACYDGIVQSVTLSPTQVDIRRVSSTVANYGLRIIDRDLAISNLVQGNAALLLGTDVEIYLGQSNAEMDFADYFKLPTTRITKVDYTDGTYNFATSETTERINKPIFTQSTRLLNAIVAGTTEILADSDLSSFPSSGWLKIDNEFVSYSGITYAENRFTGVVRGEYYSTPAGHSSGAEVYLAQVITGNPIDVILKTLISAGGGGTWDTLKDGCGISPALIDVDGILALRDVEFPTTQFQVFLYNVSNALTFLETELLTPLFLRFSVSNESKLTLKQLDRFAVREADTTIDDDTIREPPKWSVDANKIVNQVVIEWDYDEPNKKYLKRSVYADSDSVATFGKSAPYTLKFKAVRQTLDGGVLVDDFAQKLMGRLAQPNPEITLATHLDKLLLGPGERVEVDTTRVPALDGSLNFASEMEIVSRSINYLTGDVQFKLCFTTGTFNRWCFIAPSDPILVVVNSRTVRIAAGRGLIYNVGWKLKLYDPTTGLFASPGLLQVESIDGDYLTFTAEPDGVNLSTAYRLRFADYDQVSADQQRYGFVGYFGREFDDGKKRYLVTY